MKDALQVEWEDIREEFISRKSPIWSASVDNTLETLLEPLGVKPFKIISGNGVTTLDVERNGEVLSLDEMCKFAGDDDDEWDRFRDVRDEVDEYLYTVADVIWESQPFPCDYRGKYAE